ncbi:hypothetical protein AB0E74_25720 [Streptomyces sp. NPDC030392]|uniref:hypothetical protein n=1 Tax=Streptomyces sp. NPDC030392 TaxID=3155468 RepID=UPI00340993D2
MNESHPGLREWWEVPFRPVKITGIIQHEIGTPNKDGKYSVSFAIAPAASRNWEDLLMAEWSRRQAGNGGPGISVSSEEAKITLFPTTVEDIRDEYLQALKDAVDVTNQKEERIRADYMAQKETKDDAAARRKRDISAVIAELDFS